MKNIYTISAPRMVLTAVLTSILLACTVNQDQLTGQGQNHGQTKNLPLIVPENVLVEHDEEGKTSSTTMSQVKQQEHLGKHKAAKLNAVADAAMVSSYSQPGYVQAGRIRRAEQVAMPMAYSAQSLSSIRVPIETLNRENYQHFDDNQIKLVAEAPVSTFSIDVDTGAYSNVRRMINAGNLPREDAVRVEEMINYFSYDYPLPEDNAIPFSVTTEVAVTPWNANSRLLHIGIKGYDMSEKKLPASNLVFLVDVSGSMNSPDKLGLLKSALKLLTKQMRS
jgi:hypothetical protein